MYDGSTQVVIGERSDHVCYRGRGMERLADMGSGHRVALHSMYGWQCWRRVSGRRASGRRTEDGQEGTCEDKAEGVWAWSGRGWVLEEDKARARSGSGDCEQPGVALIRPAAQAGRVGAAVGASGSGMDDSRARQLALGSIKEH